MKKINLFLFALSLTVLASSCVKDQCKQELTYTNYTPVYLSYDLIRAEIKNEAPRALEHPGKIYFYQDYIFINEKEKGIHLIDNRDPNSPQPISFLPIMGNVDMAVKNNRMYADNYTDLVVLDISDLSQVRVVERQEDVFSLNGFDENGVIIRYDQEEVTEDIDCNYDPNMSWGRLNGGEFFSVDQAFPSGGFQTNNPTTGIVGGAPATGTGGSFARFSLYENYLYIVEQRVIRIFDINNPEQPNEQLSVRTGLNAETAYNYRDHLFIGGTNGMNIFDLSNPASPNHIGGYTHQTGCDPVAVHGNYAYVTIRQGRSCQGELDQLDVLDITDITAPVLEASFEMENPHGLSVTEEAVFLCEGEGGLKVFDNADPLTVGRNQLAHLDNFEAYDVINVPGQEDILLLIGADGFFQFDVSDPEQPREISHIPVITP